jgi:hypothetical protein
LIVIFMPRGIGGVIDRYFMTKKFMKIREENSDGTS